MYSSIENSFNKLFRDIRIPPNPRTIFHDYLSFVKTVFVPTERYVSFLRFLSVYMTGQLSHESFIRLVLNLFNTSDPNSEKALNYLPSFLATINTTPLHEHIIDPISNIEASKEIILQLTASLNSSEASSSEASAAEATSADSSASSASSAAVVSTKTGKMMVRPAIVLQPM